MATNPFQYLFMLSYEHPAQNPDAGKYSSKSECFTWYKLI